MKTKTIRRLAPAMIALSLTAAVFTGCGKSEDGAETKTETSGSPAVEQKKNEPGEAELRKGLAACDKNDFEAAANSFRAAAEQGNTDAMLLYFDCLAGGRGTGKDKAAAEEWLKKAVEAGNPTAQALYGSYLAGGEREAEGLEYIRRSADSGNIVGMHLLGMTALEKKNGESSADALKYLKTVASLPLSEQKTVLDYLSHVGGGNIHLTGKPDTNTNRLIVMDQYTLGVHYFGGGASGGQGRDLDEAAKWLNKAKDNGFLQAESILRTVELMRKNPDASRTKEGAGKAMTEAVMADEQSRIDAAEFDLGITITDADGKPLDGVVIMELEWARPRIPLLSGEWERKRETKKVDPKNQFRIHEKGWSELTLTFRKDGYGMELNKFDINILDEDKSKLTMRQDVQVKMPFRK